MVWVGSWSGMATVRKGIMMEKQPQKGQWLWPIVRAEETNVAEVLRWALGEHGSTLFRLTCILDSRVTVWGFPDNIGPFCPGDSGKAHQCSEPSRAGANWCLVKLWNTWYLFPECQPSLLNSQSIYPPSVFPIFCHNWSIIPQCWLLQVSIIYSGRIYSGRFRLWVFKNTFHSAHGIILSKRSLWILC